MGRIIERAAALRERVEPIAMTLFRVTVGVVMVAHGWGLGLIFGLLTPIAAAGVAFTMLVAILSAHIQNGLLAKNNGFEYPLTLMMAALWLMMRGAGPFSVDALLARRRQGSASSSGASLETITP